MGDGIVAAFILIPAILTFLLKSNAVVSFLAVCASFVAISFAGSDLENLTGKLNFSIDGSTLNLLIIGLSLLITLLFTRRTFNKGFKQFLHIFIALCAGGLLALISVPILSELINVNFAKSIVWTDLQKIQAEIVGAGVILCLLETWISGLKHHKVAKKKHK
jgi:hypothetical protein